MNYLHKILELVMGHRVLLCCRAFVLGTGEVTQRSRALAVLPEDSQSVPRNYTGWATHNGL